MTTLGRSGIETSRISLGAWGILNPDGSHPDVQVRGEDEARALLHTAFDLGINLLDSAEVYANEPELGRLIRSLDNVPENLVISTKFGHGKGFSGAQIRQSVEASLDAFGVQRIPLFMLHDPRDDDDLAVITSADGALPELRKLQDEGLVGSIGIATGTLPPLQAAVESDEFDVIQFPRLYTLLNRAAAVSGLLDRAKERNIGTILTSPFGGNILATGVRDVTRPLYSFWDAQPEVVLATSRIEGAAAQAGLSMPEAAMAFALAEPRIDAVVIGVTNERELRQDVAVADRAIDRETLDRLAEAGEIDEHHIGGPDFVWPFAMDRMPAELKAKLGL